MGPNSLLSLLSRSWRAKTVLAVGRRQNTHTQHCRVPGREESAQRVPYGREGRDSAPELPPTVGQQDVTGHDSKCEVLVRLVLSPVPSFWQRPSQCPLPQTLSILLRMAAEEGKRRPRFWSPGAMQAETD